MTPQWQEYPDDALVRAALAGEFVAFDVLVRRYRSAVLAAVSRRVASRAAAEDVCQEAFLRAFNALRYLRDPGRFAAWLHAIARREVIRHAGGAARDDTVPLDDPLLERSVALQSGQEAFARREDREEMRGALAALPEEFQLVVILHYWHEMPLDQISRFIGRPLTTVKWRLHRARALLRAQLITARADEIRDIRRDQDDPRKQQPQSRREAPHPPARQDRGDGQRSQPDGCSTRGRRGSGAHLQQYGAASAGAR